jgi:hypothetical protein
MNRRLAGTAMLVFVLIGCSDKSTSIELLCLLRLRLRRPRRRPRPSLPQRCPEQSVSLPA